MRKFFTLALTAAISTYMVCAITFIPPAPDYSDETMWFITTNDTTGEGADIFYVPATWEYDWYTEDSVLSHYADPSLKKHRDHMAIEMKGISDMLCETNNLFSPYYRHITLNIWATLDENYIDSMYHAQSFQDVKNAFSYFQENYNHGRPFILAGFSQGGKSIVELMKTLPDSVMDRMVAAYVIGYKVTPEDTVGYPRIIPAASAEDTGVTVSYNSVVDTAYVKPIISQPNVAYINPVNWSREPEIITQVCDTVTAYLDGKYGVMVVEGFDANKLKPALGIINTGDLHSADPWLYRNQLKENVERRIKAWRRKNGEAGARTSERNL